MRHLLSCFVAAFAALPACGGNSLDFSPTNGIAAPLGTTLDACPTLDPSVTLTTGNGDAVITGVCMRDELGNYYAAELSDTPPPAPGLPVLPAGHSYSIVYRFDPSYTPAASRVPGTVKAYAAADNIYGNAGASCIASPDDDAANLVPSTMTLDGDTLVVALGTPVASGQQVVTELDVAALFAGGTPCNAGGVCGEGFGAAFYVGAVPPGKADPDPGGGAPVISGPFCR